MKTILLELKAKHFKDTRFRVRPCAIDKAIEEKYGQRNYCAGAHYTIVGYNTYEIEGAYVSTSFEHDARKAEALNYSEETIRTLTLRRKHE